MLKNLFLSFGFSTVLFGCAQNIWYKPGASSDAYGQDRLACLQQSQQIESKSGTSASINSAYGAYESSSRTGAVTNTAMFNACMNGKGWVLRKSTDVADQYSKNKIANDEKKDQLQSISSQLQTLCERDEYLAFTSKTTCFDKQASLSMQTDSTRITSQQKKAMDAYMVEYESLLNQQEKIVARGADVKMKNRIQCINEKVKPLFRKNDMDLYTGRITWGQYNKNKVDLRSRIKAICSS